MSEEINYLPWFKDNKGNRWEVLEMNWCIDFGGRQCQIEAQCGPLGFKQKAFVIYGLSGEFSQWSSDEVIDCKPKRGDFYEAVMAMFKTFDTTDQVK